MTKSSNNVSDNLLLLLLRVRCFFFFNTPMHSLPPWQLKKKTAMAHCCTSPHSSCALLLLLQHVSASPSTMAVPRHVLEFAASSSSTCRCVLPHPFPPWQRRKCFLCHGSTSPLCPFPPWQRRRKRSVPSAMAKNTENRHRNSLPSSELFSDGHISIFRSL
ncbi:hypothetical protein S245_017675 [Arachis hypogaea]